MKPNASISYDPKRGFTLTNLPDPFGPYRCVANSDSKDTATVYVIPSTSPEANPMEFGDVVKRPARFGFDKSTGRLFCCSRPDTIAPTMMHFNCDHPTSCKNRKDALLYLENTATRNGTCSYIRVSRNQIAGIFRCVGDGIDIVREYFFPMGTQFEFGGAFNRNRSFSDPYFSWKQADPDKMIAIRTFADKIYEGQNVTFGCQVSDYYFSKGTRWVVGFANGTKVTVKEALRNTTGRRFSQRFRRNIITLLLTADVNLATVGCYAPVWNTSEWKHRTIEVKVQVPTKPAIVGTEVSSPTVVEWYVNETNKFFDCDATGDPAPVISWRKNDKRFYRYTTPWMNATSVKTISRINITRVSYETQGEYTCIAKNLAGTTSRTFKVVIREHTSVGLIATIMICLIAVVVALGGVVFLVIRMKNQKVLINKLAGGVTPEGPRAPDPLTSDSAIAFGIDASGSSMEKQQNDGSYHRM